MLRFPLALLLLASAACSRPPQPSIVAHTSMACSAGCAALMTTLPIDTTAASLIVLAGSDGGSKGIDFTDNQNNVWKPLQRYGANPGAQLFYCDPCATSATHTFSNTNGTSPSFAVAAFSGALATGAFDMANGTGDAPSPVSTGGVTTGQAEILVTTVADQSTSADSVDSGFAKVEQQMFSPGAGYGVSLAWKTQAAGTVNPKWTTSSPGSATIAGFRLAPRGGGGGGGGGSSAIASGTVSLPTSAIAPGVCSPLIGISAAGAKTLLYTPVADMTTVAGYAPSTSGSLYIIPVVGATPGFKVCSNSSGPITPGALSLNWSAY